MWHAVDKASGGGGGGAGGGKGRDQGEGAPQRESLRTRGVGGAEREARRKKGGRGVAEASVAAATADRLLTMDVERSAIEPTVCMISSSEKARRRFFAAPIGAAAAARQLLTRWTGWRGWSQLERRGKSAELKRSKSRTKIPYNKWVFRCSKNYYFYNIINL